jgi:hypothetical protein
MDMHRFAIKVRNKSEPVYFGTYKAAWYFVEQNRGDVAEMYMERLVDVGGNEIWRQVAIYQLESLTGTNETMPPAAAELEG